MCALSSSVFPVARVTVDGQATGEIRSGLLILLGC